MDDHASPKFPAYAQRRPSSGDEVVAAVGAAVGRTSGRGALGPIQPAARVLIVTWDHQDPDLLRLIK